MLTSLSPFCDTFFRLLWLSRLVSATGFWMDQVALGWLAVEASGPTAVGMTLGLRVFPLLLFGVIAGTVADRFPRRTILIVGGAVATVMAAVLGLVVMVADEAIQFWQIALLSFLTGCVMVFDMPTRSALVVDVVGRASLARAIALNAVAFYFFGAVGALGGGMMIARLGIAGVYFLIALCHFVGMLLLLAIRHVPVRQVKTAAPITFSRTVAGALQLIWENPGVRMVVIASVVVELFGYSYLTAVPPFARDVLRIGPEGLGALTAAASIGSTLSVMLLSFVSPSVRRQPVLTGVIVTWGLAQLGLGTASEFPPALLAMLVAGGCAAAVDALQQTLVQQAVPEGQRGRAMGVWVFSIGTNALGHYQIGLMAGTIGTPLALIINGSAALLCTLLMLTFAPSYRWHRWTTAEAVGTTASNLT